MAAYLRTISAVRGTRTTRRAAQALPWVRYITQNGDYQFRM